MYFYFFLIGAMATYLEAGGKIPIVLLTCNRPDQLRTTLASLLAVRGVSKENLIVAQDGGMKEVHGTLTSTVTSTLTLALTLALTLTQTLTLTLTGS
jgi:hypothetical protein